MAENPSLPTETSDRQSRHDSILMALVFFAVAALVANAWLVWSAVGKRRDLVREDYYEAGLREDSRRERMAAAAAYHIDSDGKGGDWVVRLSPRSERISAPSFSEDVVCRVYFQKPDDARRDFFLNLRPEAIETPSEEKANSDHSEQVAPAPAIWRWSGETPEMKSGLWNVRVEWSRPQGDSLVAFMESNQAWMAHGSR